MTLDKQNLKVKILKTEFRSLSQEQTIAQKYTAQVDKSH